MKRRIFFITVTFLSSVASAFAGNELGNGGDSLAQDFVATGRGMVAELRDNPDPRIADFPAFERAVLETKVSSTNRLELDGHEVDAINFPHERRIEISRPRWSSLDAEKRRALVLHEYLGICCDKSDRNYEISSSYTSLEGPPEIRGKYPIDGQVRVGLSSKYQGRPYRPSVGASLGLAVSRRSTMGITFDSHEFIYRYPYGIDLQTKLLEAGVFYHYWLNEARVLRPYVVAHLGYARVRGLWALDEEFDIQNKLYGRGGIGLAWKFSRMVALDLSANVDGFYAFKDYDRPESIFFNTMLGLNFYL